MTFVICFHFVQRTHKMCEALSPCGGIAIANIYWFPSGVEKLNLSKLLRTVILVFINTFCWRGTTEGTHKIKNSWGLFLCFTLRTTITSPSSLVFFFSCVYWPLGSVVVVIFHVRRSYVSPAGNSTVTVRTKQWYDVWCAGVCWCASRMCHRWVKLNS
jgi:hypothetical protein